MMTQQEQDKLNELAHFLTLPAKMDWGLPRIILSSESNPDLSLDIDLPNTPEYLAALRTYLWLLSKQQLGHVREANNKV